MARSGRRPPTGPIVTASYTAVAPLVSCRQVVREFPGVRALRGVDLDIYPGQVVALLGENGAGKSTLIRILAGADTPTSGDIFLDGRSTRMTPPRVARSLGIRVSFQEQALFPDLPLADNVYAGELVARGWGPLVYVDNDAMIEQARITLTELGASVDARIPVGQFSKATRQQIEIARAMSGNLRLLILDEPTAPLEETERQLLLQKVRDLRATGVAIVYTSHEITECLEIADRVVILRDGVKVLDAPAETLDVPRTIEAMIGKPLEAQFPKRTSAVGDVLCRVEGLRLEAETETNFEVHCGEIVGLAGLEGSGKGAILRSLYGAVRAAEGRLTVGATSVQLPTTPIKAKAAGVAFLPADRKVEGLFLEHSIEFNISIGSLKKMGRLWIRKAIERDTARKFVEALNIKTSSVGAIAVSLSGGNQQKVLLARWFNLDPRLVLLEEPTQGIDVNSKVDVYRNILRIAESGGAVLLSSSDPTELAGICDRVLIVHQGVVVDQLEADRLTADGILDSVIHHADGGQRIED